MPNCLVAVAHDAHHRHAQVGVSGEHLDQARCLGIRADHQHSPLVMALAAPHRHPGAEDGAAEHDEQPRDHRAEHDVANAETETSDAVDDDHARHQHRHGPSAARELHDAHGTDTGEEQALAAHRREADDDSGADHARRAEQAIAGRKAHTEDHREITDGKREPITGDQQHLQLVTSHRSSLFHGARRPARTARDELQVLRLIHCSPVHIS